MVAVRGRFMGNNGFGIAGRSYRILGCCICQGGALPGGYEYLSVFIFPTTTYNIPTSMLHVPEKASHKSQTLYNILTLQSLGSRETYQSLLFKHRAWPNTR